MRRFVTFAITASLVALLAFPASADLGTAGSGMSGMSGKTGAASMQQTCPPGQKWVKGYKKKSGAQVKGYCRGGKAALPKTTPAAPK